MDDMTVWREWDGAPWAHSGDGGDMLVDLGEGVFVAECVVGNVTVELVDGRIVTNRDDVVFVETSKIGDHDGGQEEADESSPEAAYGVGGKVVLGDN